MTDYTDLIARLRQDYDMQARFEAADALEAQARRIAEMEQLVAEAKTDAAFCDEFCGDYLKAKARIAELEAENKYLTELNADVYVLGVERGEAKAAARIAELKAALKPFAEHAKALDDPLYDPNETIVTGFNDMYLTAGDLRAARAAYLGEKE